MHATTVSIDTRSRRVARTTVTAAAVLIACSSSTGPDASGGGGPPTHPAGTLGSRIMSVPGVLFGIAVSANGTTYVTDLYDGVVGRFALASPSAAQPSIQVGVQPADVVFNRAGTVAYVACAGGNSGNDVWVIDVASGAVTAKLPIGTIPYRMALSPDESHLVVVATQSRVFSVPTKGGATTLVQHTGSLVSVAISPMNGAVYEGVAAGTIRRLDPATHAVLASSPGLGPELGDIVVSPNGAEVYAVNSVGALSVLDASTLAVLGGIDVGSGAYGMAMTPDGAQLYVSTTVGELVIVDRVKRTVVKRITLGGTPARIAFDKLGTTAVIANEDGWVDVVR